MNVVRQHQQRTGLVLFSEAIEDILKRFGMSQNSVKAKFRAYVTGQPIKPLEAYSDQAITL